MSDFSRREPLVLFWGDIICLLISLWLTLLIRFGMFPDNALYLTHLKPFSILFIVWLVVFFIAGLYEKQTLILKSKLPAVIFNAQVINSVLAIGFFYFIPYFGITPKTSLFIYLVVSFILILIWRIFGYRLFVSKKKQNMLLIANGEEMRELKEVVNTNARYNLNVVVSIDLDALESFDFQEDVFNRIYTDDISLVVVNLNSQKIEPLLPHLYNLILSGVRVVDMNKIYEDIFNRIPLSLVQYNWFLENISLTPKITYDVLKRTMDVIAGSVLGIISLVFYPFVALAIWLESGGPIFITQERIGKAGTLIKIHKFRTMTANDNGVYAQGRTTNVVTKVGGFLRKTRLDELPQLYNVVHGELSLIGPRPELPSLVERYEKEIPYYNIRHLIKPGLSGWAQLYHENHPHHGVAVEQTKEKLSYDLYYLKNRSFILDVTIALKTINKLISRSGA